MKELAYIAERACRKFGDDFGRANKGKSDPLALGSPKNLLACSCFSMVRCFFGKEGCERITQTPADLFGTFVKDVADYASGHKEMGDFELDTAIDIAVLWGREDIEKRRLAGEDLS